MLGWIVKAVLFRKVLRRFWWFPVLLVVLQKVLPWEKQRAAEISDLRRGKSRLSF